MYSQLLCTTYKRCVECVLKNCFWTTFEAKSVRRCTTKSGVRGQPDEIVGPLDVEMCSRADPDAPTTPNYAQEILELQEELATTQVLVIVFAVFAILAVALGVVWCLWKGRRGEPIPAAGQREMQPKLPRLRDRSFSPPADRPLRCPTTVTYEDFMAANPPPPRNSTPNRTPSRSVSRPPPAHSPSRSPSHPPTRSPTRSPSLPPFLTPQVTPQRPPRMRMLRPDGPPILDLMVDQQQQQRRRQQQQQRNNNNDNDGDDDSMSSYGDVEFNFLHGNGGVSFFQGDVELIQFRSTDEDMATTSENNHTTISML